VAYIRFASVYKSFQDVGDFSDAIDAVTKPPARRRKAQ
jgi:transcriptional repressor NrdR